MTESEVEQSVRRIEELIAALDAVTDPVGREAARALLEVVLDLHALALARMTAMIAAAGPSSNGGASNGGASEGRASQDGAALLQRLAGDESIRAVLLLHGLHPDSVEIRVGRAVESLRPQFAARGLDIKLVASSAALVRVRVRWISEAPAPRDATALREEIAAAIIEAAPDLETLEIEGLDETAAVLVG